MLWINWDQVRALFRRKGLTSLGRWTKTQNGGGKKWVWLGGIEPGVSETMEKLDIRFSPNLFPY
jgi:hypothetical protein